MQLRFVFGDEDILLDPSDKLRWACLQIKFEFIEKGPCSISVGLLNDETTILEGSNSPMQAQSNAAPSKSKGGSQL